MTKLHEEGKELTGRDTTITQLPTRPPEIAIYRLLGAVAAVIVPMRIYIYIVSDTPKSGKHLSRQPIFAAADI